MSNCEKHELDLDVVARIHPDHYREANSDGYTVKGYPDHPEGPYTVWQKDIKNSQGKVIETKEYFWHLMFCREPKDEPPTKYLVTWVFHEGQGDSVGQSPDPGGHPPGPNKYNMLKNDWDSKIRQVDGRNLNEADTIVDSTDPENVIDRCMAAGVSDNINIVVLKETAHLTDPKSGA